MKRNKAISAVAATIIIIALLLVISFLLSGCGNKQIIDTKYRFDYAIILLPNGEVVDGPVESWTDFDDGDQIQVKIDGVTYLTHSMNVVLEGN